jgi:hypothetical protein
MIVRRTSYLNAVLIQSRGTECDEPCEACAKNPSKQAFTECRRTEGFFGGCCGNCKWKDHAIRCTVREDSEEDSEEGSEEESEEGEEEGEEDDGVEWLDGSDQSNGRPPRLVQIEVRIPARLARE